MNLIRPEVMAAAQAYAFACNALASLMILEGLGNSTEQQDLQILRARLRQDLVDAEYLPPLAPPGGPQPEPGETYSAAVGGYMPEPALAHAASDGGSDCSASVGGE